jgi:hypothetical protein
MEFGEHKVETHARETDLSMVYTINPAMVEDYINTVEQLLARDKYKVVGIDLQYTGGHPGKVQKVAVTQLSMRHHVLIYHYCMATEPCDRFARFCQQHRLQVRYGGNLQRCKGAHGYGLGLQEPC